MKRNPLKYTALLVLVLATACSSNPKSESPKGYLATHIFEDGSKQFVYTVDLPNPSERGNRGRGNGRPGNVQGNVQGSSNRGLSAGVTAGSGSQRGGKGSRRPQSMDGLLVSSLESELKKNSYCRDGYMELDRMTEPSNTFIKGECLEAATESDRAEFPNASE